LAVILRQVPLPQSGKQKILIHRNFFFCSQPHFADNLKDERFAQSEEAPIAAISSKGTLK